MRTAPTFAISFLIWLAAVPASAAPTPAQKADAALREGQALDKAGKTAEALQKFEDAYAIVPSGAAAYDIAREEAALGRHALALQHFREALRDPKLTTDQRRDAEAQIEVLKTKIGVLTLDVPEGATTTIDGNEVDAKEPVEVPPGLHVVKIRLGGETKSEDVTATAGAVTPVKVRFDEVPPVAPPPTVGPPPAAEAHHLWGWPTPKLVTVGAGAAVSAGLLTGSLIELATADKVKAPSPTACQDRSAPGCAGYASKRDSYDASRTLSTVFFYSGLVVGAAAAVAAIVWPNESQQARARVSGPGSLLVRF